jgi:ribosomal protein S27E
MLKRVMRLECVSCVPRVFLHAIVACVACGTELLDVLGIKIRVAMLVRESTYTRSSHGSCRRSALRYLPRTRVQDTHY